MKQFYDLILDINEYVSKEISNPLNIMGVRTFLRWIKNATKTKKYPRLL